jgi:hypothetical protein
MLEPDSNLDPFGGGPPNPNPNTPKWIVGSIVAALGTTAFSQFVHPNEGSDMSLNQLNLNNNSRTNTQSNQNGTSQSSGGSSSGGSTLHSILNQLSVVLTQLSHFLSSFK